MSVRTRIQKVAAEKDLRDSTALSYQRLLGYLGLLDRKTSSITKAEVEDALYANIRNPNTRRAAVIAVRSVLGIAIKIPKGLPRRYDLPDEATLLRALAHSPHEVRGLIMMYAACRIGEACAVTRTSLRGPKKDRLLLDIQVQQLHRTGEPTITRVRPVKTAVGEVRIPPWLSERIEEITETAKPDCVRESLRRAGMKEGIHINPHMLRHWYGSHMLNNGAPLRLVSQQMRHSDVAITASVYHDYDAETVIDRIFGEDPTQKSGDVA